MTDEEHVPTMAPGLMQAYAPEETEEASQKNDEAQRVNLYWQDYKNKNGIIPGSDMDEAMKEQVNQFGGQCPPIEAGRSSSAGCVRGDRCQSHKS